MAITLALISALLYGAGDFFGGLSARRLAPLLIGFLTHAMVIVPMALIALLVGSERVTSHDLAWGAAGAIAGGLGVVLLYRGLAVGPMSIVSPLTAMVAAAVPVLFGLLDGERPSTAQWIGIALALVAILFMTRVDPRPGEARSLAMSTLGVALLAGVGFGFYFIALDRTSDASGLWPIAAGRVASASMFGLLVLARPVARRTFSALRGNVLAYTCAAATGDVAANAFYLLAVRRGSLAIVSILSALYPASTVVLASRFLHERFNRDQRVGLGVAALAIALVAGG